MQHKTNLIAPLAIAAAFFLAACTSTDNSTTAKNEPIDYITMSFPEQIQWQQQQNKKLDNGGIIAEWIVKGSTSQNTPVRVVYNKLLPGSDTKSLLDRAIEPLKTSCADIKITNLPATSKHANQTNMEVICSRMGKNNFGMVFYFTALADAKATHVVRSETKTIASEKAGTLVPANKQQQQQVKNSAAIIALMNNFSKTVRACDAQKVCR